MFVLKEVLHYKLMGILDEESGYYDLTPNGLEKAYSECSTEEKKYFYQELILLLTHLEFSESEAKNHWKNIVSRYHEIKDNMGRNINLRVALLDYFTTDYKLLKNPIIIEIFLYDIAAKRALIDEMTGLYNFRYLQSALKIEHRRSTRRKYNYSIAFIDLDNLKDINDNYGHLTGDDTIKEIAKLIKNTNRAEDVSCRYGGDEFVCILPETNKTEAIQCLKRILDTVKNNFSSWKFPVSISAGVATYPDDGKTALQVLEYADKALYQAKIAGKNRVISWTAAF